MSKMTLTVNFLAGTALEEAIKEAKKKAIKYDLAYILFNFNGVDFSIGRYANIEEVLGQYPKTNFIVSA